LDRKSSARKKKTPHRKRLGSIPAVKVIAFPMLEIKALSPSQPGRMGLVILAAWLSGLHIIQKEHLS